MDLYLAGLVREWVCNGVSSSRGTNLAIPQQECTQAWSILNPCSTLVLWSIRDRRVRRE